MALLADFGSRGPEPSFDLIWLKPDKELGQGPLAAKQSVSRTLAELGNENKQEELERLCLAFTSDLF